MIVKINIDTDIGSLKILFSLLHCCLFYYYTVFFNNNNWLSNQFKINDIIYKSRLANEGKKDMNKVKTMCRWKKKMIIRRKNN